MSERFVVKRMILPAVIFLGVVGLSASAYSNYFELALTPVDVAAETGFASAVRGSQLTPSDVDEIALRLASLPDFAEIEPADVVAVATR